MTIYKQSSTSTLLFTLISLSMLLMLITPSFGAQMTQKLTKKGVKAFTADGKMLRVRLPQQLLDRTTYQPTAITDFLKKVGDSSRTPHIQHEGQSMVIFVKQGEIQTGRTVKLATENISWESNLNKTGLASSSRSEHKAFVLTKHTGKQNQTRYQLAELQSRDLGINGKYSFFQRHLKQGKGTPHQKQAQEYKVFEQLEAYKPTTGQPSPLAPNKVPDRMKQDLQAGEMYLSHRHLAGGATEWILFNPHQRTFLRKTFSGGKTTRREYMSLQDSALSDITFTGIVNSVGTQGTSGIKITYKNGKFL